MVSIAQWIRCRLDSVSESDLAMSGVSLHRVRCGFELDTPIPAGLGTQR